MEKVLGPEHPNTLRNLARMLHNQKLSQPRHLEMGSFVALYLVY